MAEQLTLEAVAKQYEGVASLTNEELYEKLIHAGVVKRSELNKVTEIGKAKQRTSPLKRSIRWLQQSLKQNGVLQKSGERGSWKLAVSDTEMDLSMFVAPEDIAIVGYSTELGMCVWGDSRQVVGGLPSDTPIQLVFTSPPYPIQKPRSYDRKRTETEFIMLIVRF